MGTVVTCPWHGWEFDIRSGQTPLGPKIKQPVYEVKVEDQDVLVDALILTSSACPCPPTACCGADFISNPPQIEFGAIQTGDAIPPAP